MADFTKAIAAFPADRPVGRTARGEHFIEIAKMADVTDEAIAALDVEYGIIDGPGSPA